MAPGMIAPVRNEPFVSAADERAEAAPPDEAADAMSETPTTPTARDRASGKPTGETVARVGYAPIVRVDEARREIELCATSEAVDRHGTVFDYDASKAAFTRWLGNVREMHERRAVGSRVAVRCDDEARKVFVRVRISQGAQDTWEKVLDGTLRGASIGATQVVWQRQRRTIAGRERWLDVATSYELAELSLVDNPSNPDALGVTFVRAALPDLALLDEVDDRPTPQPLPIDGKGSERRGSEGDDSTGDHWLASQAWRGAKEGTVDEERAQGPFSPNTEGYPDMGVPERAEERPTAEVSGMTGLASPSDGAGNTRERLHTAASGLLVACGCALCEAALAALAPTPDPSPLPGEGEAERSQDATVYEAALTRALATGWRASMRRIEGMEAAMQAMAASSHDLAKGVTQAVMDGLAQRLTETLAEQDALGKRVAALEAQPMAGGPAARPVEKTHALMGGATRGAASGGAGLGSATAHSYYGGYEAVSAEEQYRALEALAGKLRDPQAQIAVATELIRLRQG